MRALKGLKALGLSLAVAAILAGLDLLSGQGFSAGRSIGRLALALGALLVGWLGTPWVGRHWWLPTFAVFGAAAGLGAATATWRHTTLAWAALSAGLGILIILDSSFRAAFLTIQRPRVRWVASWGMRSLLAGAGGLVPVALTQIKTRFAEEEFFGLMQGMVLAGIALTLLGGFALLRLGREAGPGTDKPARRPSGIRVYALLLAVILLGGATWLGTHTLAAYRASFAPSDAPGYPGITVDSPFLCGTVPPAPGTPSGQEVYERALRQVELWPNAGTPELALLAVSSGDRTRAEAFRQALLAEARSGAFTGAAHSVKSAQYDAALRIYFTALVQDAFPDLFSAADQAIVKEWVEAINDRAWQVEWVDLLYALAFGLPPDGPYENQEIGAGLLALLEAEGMAAPQWSAANREYLASAGLGWAERFRNPDDAFLYQAVWINNALFQDLLRSSSQENQRLAFEWLLLQALPDGEPLSYDHPARPPLVATWYQGARLLGDGRYMWLADRALLKVEEKGTGLEANPGLEAPLSLEGRSPTAGSCLIYGDSGLPLSPGPLAPDKIVFRDGWQRDSAYLLLNLRFTGWHRYKATNAVIQLYQDGPLVVEGGTGQPVRWLPLGRQTYRDKRIAREDLNGLLIPRDGLDGAIQMLTGQGSPWAQDPPPYAAVETFQALGTVDVSRTTLRDWRGWTHTRSIYFIHGGPVVVVDDAWSSSDRSGVALIWHPAGGGQQDADSLWLRTGESPARLAIPADAWPATDLLPASRNGDPGVNVLYSSPQRGQLHLVTAFLTGDWVAAAFDAHPLEYDTGQVIQIAGPSGEFRILHNPTSGWLEIDGLGSDGLAAVGWWPADEGKGWLCYVEASWLRVGDDPAFRLDKPESSACITLEGNSDSD